MSCGVQSADRVVHTQQDVLEKLSRIIIDTDRQHREQMVSINQKFAERDQEIAKLTQEKRWGTELTLRSPLKVGWCHLAACTKGPQSWSNGIRPMPVTLISPQSTAAAWAQVASAALSDQSLSKIQLTQRKFVGSLTSSLLHRVTHGPLAAWTLQPLQGHQTHACRCIQ